MLFTQSCSKPIADDEKADENDEKGEKDIDRDGEGPVRNGEREGGMRPDVCTG